MGDINRRIEARRTLIHLLLLFLLLGLAREGYAQELFTSASGTYRSGEQGDSRSNAQRADSLALVALYESTDGPKWNTADGWLTGSLLAGHWEHVEIRNGRVAGLSLAGNNLAGQLPADIGDLTALKTLSLDRNKLTGSIPLEVNQLQRLNALFIAGNEISELPPLNDMTRLMLVDVTDNRLTFEDLEPLDLKNPIRYEGQQDIGRPDFVQVMAGEQLELHVAVGGSNNVYEWSREGVTVGASSDRLVVESVSVTDAGTYTLRVSNASVPGLLLASHPITVEVLTPVPDAMEPESGLEIAGDGSGLRLHGDIQLRAELDRSTSSFDGSDFPDQDRVLARLRFGFSYRLSDHVSFGGRLQTRSTGFPSSHVALGDELTSKDVGIDRMYAMQSWTGGAAWVGKNAFPFWTQNEILWDRDTSPEGIATTHSHTFSERAAIKATAAVFVLQSAVNTSFFNLSRLGGFQFLIDRKARNTSTRVSASYFDFSHNPEIEDLRLEDRNYRIATLGARVRYDDWKFPVEAGAEFYRNLQGYPTKLHNGGERSAWTISATVGNLEDRGTWEIGYSYSFVGKFAVASGYAQDDRVRWHSRAIARASNYKGHEIMTGVAVNEHSSFHMRVMTARAIRPESPETTNLEKGVRFQIDWDVRF